MKRSIIIAAMLVAVLQLSAQSNSRRRAASDPENPARKSESTQAPKPVEKTEKKVVSRERSETRSTTQSREVAKPVAQPQDNKRTSSQPETNSNRQENRAPANNSERRVNTDPTKSAPANKESTRSAGGNENSRNRSTTSPTDQPQQRRESRDAYNNPNAPRTAAPARPDSRERVTGNNNNTGTNRSAQSTRGNEYKPRTGSNYEQARRTYETPARKSIVRTTYRNSGYTYRPIDYRRIHYPYRAPARVEIYWSLPMYHQYRAIYPDYDYWYYPIGYSIHTVSAYDASLYFGELARIYGKVEYVWYSRPTNEYYLYFGGPYPYQDFSLIVPANVARRFSRRPERFFTNRHIAVTGLVSSWEGKPEMLIKKSNQLDIY